MVNQIDEEYDTLSLASKVERVAEEFGLTGIGREYIENPRIESEEHFYQVEHRLLPSLGFRREKELEEVIREIFIDVTANKARAVALKGLIYPTVRWDERLISSERFPLPRHLRSFGLQPAPELRDVRRKTAPSGYPSGTDWQAR